MSKASKARDERIEIRCHAEEKEILRRAAKLDDRTLSNWLLHVTLREARRALAEEQAASRETRSGFGSSSRIDTQQ